MLSRVHTTFCLLASLILTLVLAAPAAAHPTPLGHAIMTVDSGGSYHLLVTFDVTASVVQAPPGHLSDELIQELRTMPGEKLEEWVAEARQVFERRLILRFDGVPMAPLIVEFPSAATLREGELADGLRKPRSVHIHGRAPPTAQSFSVTFPPDCGQVIFTMLRADQSRGDMTIGEGAASEELAWHNPGGPPTGRRWQVAGQYLVLGFEHILPKGLDHILFVLGLYLLSPNWRPLLAQVTMFTLAHSVTLALSSLDLVSLPASVVEPLIALSIAIVAIENIVTPQLHRWRLPVVFAFGLLHGLGFAGVLGELGLPRDEFVTGLVTFNVGVELGQLSVLALAALTIGCFRGQSWYRPLVVQPVSAAIAIVGLYWTIERIGWLP